MGQMRYLVVHGRGNRFLAEQLKASALPAASDVSVIIVEDRARLFIPEAGAPVLCAGMRPKVIEQYRAAGCVVDTVASLHADRQRVLAWLDGQLVAVPATGTVPIPLPSVAFRDAVAATPQMRLAEGALAQADKIHPGLHDFAARAARELAVLANSGRVGQNPVKYWKSRDLDHATSGGTRFKLHAQLNGKKLPVRESLLHFRSGGRGVAPELAPRIYYATIHPSKFYVIVLYCGPHPTVDEVSMSVDLGEG